jgi:hypothetical protein
LIGAIRLRDQFLPSSRIFIGLAPGEYADSPPRSNVNMHIHPVGLLLEMHIHRSRTLFLGLLAGSGADLPG